MATDLPHDTSDSYPYFTRVLVVMNEVLLERRHESPYRDLAAACADQLAGQEMGVEVYEDDPEQTVDYYAIRYRDGEFELVTHGRHTHEAVWRVSSGYLRHVALDPQRHVDNPELLDWQWLTHRLGLAPVGRNSTD